MSPTKIIVQLALEPRDARALIDYARTNGMSGGLNQAIHYAIGRILEPRKPRFINKSDRTTRRNRRTVPFRGIYSPIAMQIVQNHVAVIPGSNRSMVIENLIRLADACLINKKLYAKFLKMVETFNRD